jgi:periplasmic protein TonB
VILAHGVLLTPACASTPSAAGPPEQVVVQPEAIERQAPTYPPELRAAGVEGEVVARAVIGEDGRVRDVEIVRTDHPLFAEALLETVPRWRFRPATVDGLPIEIDYTLVQQFKLDQ